MRRALIEQPRDNAISYFQLLTLGTSEIDVVATFLDDNIWLSLIRSNPLHIGWRVSFEMRCARPLTSRLASISLELVERWILRKFLSEIYNPAHRITLDNSTVTLDPSDISSSVVDEVIQLANDGQQINGFILTMDDLNRVLLLPELSGKSMWSIPLKLYVPNRRRRV
jgi:hypothetical protein